MASSDLHYFIVSQPLKALISRKPGQICSTPSFKLRKQGKSLDVVFTDSLYGVDFPVDRESLQPISREEAGLLMALPEPDRLTALNQPQGLRSARRLREGTEVWVQEEESTLLKGTIHYIGSITEPKSKWDVPEVFYGVELQGSDRGRGSTDGSFKSKPFFSCDKDCGVFAPFNRITAVGPQTSPDPQTRERLGMRLSLKSKPDPRPGSNRDQDQPLSFRSDHFPQDPPQRESRPESRPEYDPSTSWDSAPKSLSADPEPMEQDHLYEDPDQLQEPAKGFSRFKSKSAKLGHVPDKSNNDRKDKPKYRPDWFPGSAKRAAAPVPESRPEPSPETEEADHVKSRADLPKSRLADLLSPRLGSRPQSETDLKTRPRTGARCEPESGPESGLRRGTTETGLQTGDQVMFIDDKEKTVKGTFIFTEETGGETRVHITGESGMHFVVPLVSVMKLEQEEETEDIYADPKGDPGLQFEEKPAQMKSWCEAVKPSPQSEAEPKARPRTEVSPRGPKPGLGHGSANGLIAGDQVLFMGEKDEVKEGAVVFMEETAEGAVVHVEGASGTFIVPLLSVTKMEPKTDTEDLYSAAPPMDSLVVDSVVEIDLAHGVKGYGTVRWIGFLPGVAPEMAGLELEEQRGVSDGTFKGQRFFKCPDKHALFVKLLSCRPDSRFIKTSANHNGPNKGGSANHSGPYHNGFTPHHGVHDTGEFDLEPVPPVAVEDVEGLLIGRMKGIQGHHNSCYMDSALFSLFSVSSVLDSLLFKSTSPQDADVQKILLRDIVNPLRRNGFVQGHHVMNLRKQLQKHGFSQSFTTDEKDPEEFLTVIMQHILNLDPLLKLCSGGKVQDSFCFQIFLDQKHELVLPSVQQLLEHSFHSNALKLAEVPSCLILQMPRFGKKFKMFDKILPSLELDVTDLLQHGPKQCVLCAEAALWECPNCFLDPTFGSNGLKLFCDQCTKQVHAHPRRHGHQPAPLDSCSQSDRFHGNRDKLHLLAVLCIETSHYVSFVKYGPEPQHWLFFDSMADRYGEADGFNVPEVTLVPELDQYLKMSLSELANQAPRDMKGVAKRLLCDAYLYLYQSPALHLYA